MPGSSQLSAAGSSVSLAVAESQDTLAPALSIDRLEDIVDLDFGLRRAATAPSGGLPAVEIQGQAFYEPSVAAKAQARQDRLAAGRPMGGEDWGDDFEDLSDGSTVDDDGGPGFRLKLSEDVAKRQEQVRRDAENMRSFAHHIEDLRFLHQRAKDLSSSALSPTQTNAAVKASQLYQRFLADIEKARILLDFADVKGNENGTGGSERTEDRDVELLAEMLGLDPKGSCSPTTLTPTTPAVTAGNNNEEEEEDEDWDAEFGDSEEVYEISRSTVLVIQREQTMAIEADIAKLRLSPAGVPPKPSTTPSSATLGGLVVETEKRIRFEVSMIPTLTVRIEELKKRLAEYAMTLELVSGKRRKSARGFVDLVTA